MTANQAYNAFKDNMPRGVVISVIDVDKAHRCVQVNWLSGGMVHCIWSALHLYNDSVATFFLNLLDNVRTALELAPIDGATSSETDAGQSL